MLGEPPICAHFIRAKFAESPKIGPNDFASPTLADAANTIVAGHGRVAAAKLLKMATVPTVEVADILRDAQRRMNCLNPRVGIRNQVAQRDSKSRLSRAKDKRRKEKKLR